MIWIAICTKKSFKIIDEIPMAVRFPQPFLSATNGPTIVKFKISMPMDMKSHHIPSRKYFRSIILPKVIIKLNVATADLDYGNLLMFFFLLGELALCGPNDGGESILMMTFGNMIHPSILSCLPRNRRPQRRHTIWIGRILLDIWALKTQCLHLGFSRSPKLPVPDNTGLRDKVSIFIKSNSFAL